MNWTLWGAKIGSDVLLAIIPVVTAAIVALQENPKAPLWAIGVAAGGLVLLRALANYLKHRNWPIAPQE